MLSVQADDKQINISVSTVDQVAYYPQSSAPATTLSLNDATLSAQIQSSIVSIPVKVTDTVNQGDILVELDCHHATAIKESSQAQLSLAEFQLQRAKKLRKGNNISEELLRKLQSDLLVARSAVKISTVDVQRCKIVAPFRGEVTQRIADVGEWVNKGEPVVQLVDLDNVEVSAQLPNQSFKKLQDVSRFDFVVADKRYPLKLRGVSEVADKISRTREVRLQFTDNQAQPGQSGRLIWQDARRYLPASFLIKRKNEYGVFVVQDNHARFIAVPDAQEGRPIGVMLDNDVLVIDKGRHSVNENDPVNIIH